MSEPAFIEIEFPESPIPEGTLRRFGEVTLRRNGCVWRIHKSDADPFPSLLHAHNLESGLKLHLGTGQLYLGARDTGKRLDHKHLAFIHAELTQCGFTLPPCPSS